MHKQAFERYGGPDADESRKLVKDYGKERNYANSI
jgi:hypothetical protein